jgi:hypothetical protein
LEEWEMEGTHADFPFMATMLETFIKVLCREDIKLCIGYTSTADLSSDFHHRNPTLGKPSLILIAFL